MKLKIFIIAIFAAIALGAMAIFSQSDYIKCALDYISPRLVGRKSVEDIVRKYEAKVLGNLQSNKFIASYGFPEKIVIVADKDKKMLYLFGKVKLYAKYELIKKYPFTNSSGTLGPKLKMGDLQIPEGIYKMESLNPNSLYHLALRVNYPNEFDKEKARLDGRPLESLGGDIMIHGRSCTVGCIPIGDPAIEEVFVLCAKAGIGNVDILILPYDLTQKNPPFFSEPLPSWHSELINKLYHEQLKYRKQGVQF